MRVHVVPVLRDNYAYIVQSVTEAATRTAVVDPGEAGPVLDQLEKLGATLDEIWCTHHHADHIGGAADLQTRFPNVIVRASSIDVSRGLAPKRALGHEDNAEVLFGDIRLLCWLVPGHTLGAVTWVAQDAHDSAAGRSAFTGDVLFSGGCGRVFEGTHEQMHASLMRLRALPADTSVYCGHEYTVKNLEFSAKLLGGDPQLERALSEKRAQRESNVATVPSTIGFERANNVFLRSDDPRVARAVGLSDGADPAAVFSRVRIAKDNA